MINPTAGVAYRQALTAHRAHPRVITERTHDGAEICVHGLELDCAVTARIRGSRLRITATREGQERWTRGYELPQSQSAQVKGIRWDGKVVRVTVRLN